MESPSMICVVETKVCGAELSQRSVKIFFHGQLLYSASTDGINSFCDRWQIEKIHVQDTRQETGRNVGAAS